MTRILQKPIKKESKNINVSRYTSLHHSIDVSGNPPRKTAFGLFSIKRSYLNRFYKDFKKKYPLFVSKKAKASTLRVNEIKKILEFLDSENIHMRAIVLENKDWMEFKDKYEHRKRYFNERMYGLIYSTILKTCSYKNYLYAITLCKERYLFKPELSMQICRDVSKSSGYDFSLSFGDRRTNIELRFADFIAGAALKADKKFLDSLSNFHLINLKIPVRYFLKIFNFYSK